VRTTTASGVAVVRVLSAVLLSRPPIELQILVLVGEAAAVVGDAAVLLIFAVDVEVPALFA
jgi:hypothetical protein